MGNVIRQKNNTSSHKIQVKLDLGGGGSNTVGGIASSSSTTPMADSIRKSKEILTLRSSTKKVDKKKSSKLPKSVKISNTVSVQNGDTSSIPLNSNNSNGNNQPVKPPRKSKSLSGKEKSEKSEKLEKNENVSKKCSSSNGSSPPSSSATTTTTGNRHVTPSASSTTSRSQSPKPKSKGQTPSRSASRSPTPTKLSSPGGQSSISRVTSKTIGRGLAVSKTLTDGLSKMISSKSSSGGSSSNNKLIKNGKSKLSKETTTNFGTKSPVTPPTTPTTTQVNLILNKPIAKPVVVVKQQPTTIVTITQKPLAPPAEIKVIRALPYYRRYEPSFYSSTPSLYSYKSLPTLAPYLAETKRVTNSIFLTRTRTRSPSPTVGFPRPTKTSLMREIIARDPISFKDSTFKHISDSTGTLSTLKNADGESGGLSATSVLDLGFKPRQRRRRSVSCLNLKDYTQYILQLRHTYRNPSPRFNQLHRLYSSLDRLYQLERSTASLYDVSPVLSHSKRNDFDAWWKVRNRLRIEQEMALISRQLLQAQNDREFFFKPKLLENFRWTADFDSHLRFKKWSVEELKSFLLTGEMPGSVRNQSMDLYKTQWRGMSVKELALNLEVNELVKRQQNGSSRQDECFYENRIPLLRRAFSMSSTLSEEQREGIKRRIGNLVDKSIADPDDYQQSGRSSRASQRVQTSRMGFTLSSDRRDMTSESIVSRSTTGLTESVKKEISRNISEELKERRVKETNLLRDSFKNPTSVTLPVSTKIALRKAESVREKRTTTLPFYSVYCRDGVNNRIAVFEKRCGANHDENAKNLLKSNMIVSEEKQSITRNNKKPSVKIQIVPPTPAPSTPVTKVTKAKVTKTSDYKKSTSLDGPASLPVFKSSSSPTRRSPSPLYFSRRTRSPIRRSASPEQLGKEYVSHVNIISKLASLLLKRNTSLKNLVTREVLERDKLERLRSLNSGEVERLRDYFESYEDYYGIKSPEINLLRCLFCSDSNLAKITEKLDLDHRRRCASASSPTPGGRGSRGTSPTLYLNTRSRKPIYQPSSTPNVCQPTLTAHCFLQPSESLERVESPTNYEANYDSLPHSFSSPAPSSLSSYYGSNITQPHPPRRILDERLVATSLNMINNTWTTNQYPAPLKGYSYTNYDPAAHQPRYRYIPPPPIIPKTINTTGQRGGSDYYYRSSSALGLPYIQRHYNHDLRGLRRSESFHSTVPPSRQRSRVMSPPPPRGYTQQQWNNQVGQMVGKMTGKWDNNRTEGNQQPVTAAIKKQESSFARISSVKRSSSVPQETEV